VAMKLTSYRPQEVPVTVISLQNSRLHQKMLVKLTSGLLLINTSHPGQLSLAVPLYVSAITLHLDVNRHTARCTIRGLAV